MATSFLFLQIGDENVHRVRALLDEVFRPENCVAEIISVKTSGSTQTVIPTVSDFVIWYAKNKSALSDKYHPLYKAKRLGEEGATNYNRIMLPSGVTRNLTTKEIQETSLIPNDAVVYSLDNLTSQSIGREKGYGAASWFDVNIKGRRQPWPEGTMEDKSRGDGSSLSRRKGRRYGDQAWLHTEDL